MADLERVYSVDVNGNWGWSTEEATGGGGSQDLAQVLVAGGDPDGNPITGAVTISPSGDVEALGIYGADGSTGNLLSAYSYDTPDPAYVFGIGPAGAVTISPSDAVLPLQITAGPGAETLATIWSDGLEWGAFFTKDGLEIDGDGTGAILRLVGGAGYDEVFAVGPTGAVTISPSAAVSGLTVKAVGGSTVLEVSAGLATIAGSFILETTVAVDDGINLMRTDDNRSTFYVSPSALEVRGTGTQGGGGHKRVIQAGLQQGAESLLLADTGGTVGFYGTNPIAKQTGVAVSAAGVHAALVSLGLIAA